MLDDPPPENFVNVVAGGTPLLAQGQSD